MPALDFDHDDVLAPLLAPKTIGRKVAPMARKPALELRAADRLRRERIASIAFGEALDECGLSNVAVAELWNTTESVVRGIRQRQRALSYVQFRALPKNVRDVLDRKTDERRDLVDSLPLLPESLRPGSVPVANDHYPTR